MADLLPDDIAMRPLPINARRFMECIVRYGVIQLANEVSQASAMFCDAEVSGTVGSGPLSSMSVLTIQPP
jgi:hypothetical protein